MNVRLEVLCNGDSSENANDLRFAALELTDEPKSLRVFPKETQPEWLVAEFTMPSQRQMDAADRIYRSVNFQMPDRVDLAISFSKK